MPTARINPRIVMLLRVNPSKSISAKVPAIDAGIDNDAITVVRQSRIKTRIVRLTNKTAIAPWRLISSIAPRINRD